MKNLEYHEKAPFPKVEFKLASIEDQAGIVNRFYARNDPRWMPMFTQVFPELKDAINKSQNDEDKFIACKTIVEKKIYSQREKLTETKLLLENEWGLINNLFLSTLSKHFETEWPTDKETMEAKVSILPIFPRDLDTYSFYVGVRDAEREIETTAHEIVHFLWFKKWKEVFPETPREQYEIPHLVWRLSEIMDPIILQCQPEIKELIKPKGWGYSSFEKIKIGDIGMTEHFKNLYLKCVDEGKSFENILRICYAEAQKYKKEISTF